MPQQPVFYSGRSITTVHDLTTARFANPAKNPVLFKIKQQVYRSLIRRVARRSAGLIAVSQFTKDDLVKFSGINPDKVRVIYEAADKIETKPEPVLELVGKKYLLFVGRPNPHKNLNRLVEALAKLQQTQPNVLLVLAGKTDPNYEQLQKYVSQKNLTSQVVFTDFIDDSQLRWLYENALAYVFPSLSEGFGLPGLEAMCYRLPVVSSNATCLPEIYQDAALYFDPLDIDDMAHKLERIVSDPALQADLAKKGSALVKTYSWQKTAQQTLDAYLSVFK
jgi:glycosyltransferase involved in cell wall biosynthesis